MISAISNSCFQYPIEIRKKVALTAIEFLALSSIAAVLISLYGLTTYGYVGIGISCFLGVLDLSLFGFSFCHSSSSSSQYSVRSSNLRFGLSSSYSEEFAQQTLGFSSEANGQRPFASWLIRSAPESWYKCNQHCKVFEASSNHPEARENFSPVR